MRTHKGFSLIELMVVVAIIGILTSIAYPNYIEYLVKTRRAAATACLSEYAQYMERVYTTNLRYDQNGGSATTLPTLACQTSTSSFYTYQFKANTLATLTYTVEAVPQGVQATKDTACGTLTLTQTGAKGKSGGGSLTHCWG